MYSQSVVTFSEGSVMDAVQWLLRSIPAIFKPMEKDNMRLVDGGILERVPAAQLKEMGADKIVAIDVLGQKECKEKCPNAVGMLLEMIDLMDNYRTGEAKRGERRDYRSLAGARAWRHEPIFLQKVSLCVRSGIQAGGGIRSEIKELLG